GKFPDNVIVIETAEAIQELQETNRLLDETVIRARNAVEDEEETEEDAERGSGGVITRIKLLVKPIRPVSRRAAARPTSRDATAGAARGGRPTREVAPTAASASPAPARGLPFGEKYQRVWQ